MPTRRGAGRNGDGGAHVAGTRGNGDGFIPLQTYRTGMWLLVAAIVMLFAGLTSAMVVRKGLGGDWVGLTLPRILYFNTAVLIASSAALERARRRLAGGAGTPAAGGWLMLAALLGVAFAAGQVLAWIDLVRHGILASTNPSSSFFYVFSGLHGAHLLGGIVAMFYAIRAIRAIRAIGATGATGAIGRLKSAGSTSRARSIVGAVALYWHFLTALWVYIMALLALS